MPPLPTIAKMSRLLVFVMGQHLKPGCPDDCELSCRYRTPEDQCKLYSCPECGEFIYTGQPTVRVIFRATEKMESRQAYLYGKGRGKLDKEYLSFKTFHKDCYIVQHLRWIDEQLAHPTTAHTGI